MKTGTIFILSLAAVIIFSRGKAFAKYSGGSGEPNNPYRISSVTDLLAMAANTNDYDKCFILIADVNMAGRTFTTAVIAPDTDNTNIEAFDGTAFTGVFDGAGHKVMHLNISAGEAANAFLGLFGYIGVAGKVKNLAVENVSITANNSSFVGGLVGYAYYSNTISNCYATGSITGDNGYVGGLIGYNWGSTISNCYSAGTTGGGGEVGGLAGYNYFGAISNCYSKCTVSGVSSEIGGVAGCNWCGTISNCYSTGTVGGGWDVGGLVGHNYSGSRISNCYSTGSVIGNDYDIGGLVGRNEGATFNCYSTGAVSGSAHVGGLVGWNDVDIIGSFWDMQTSGLNTSAGGTGKTTAEMRTLSTFTSDGWDFVQIWDIGENQTYPFLRKYPAGDLNHDGIVNFLDVAILAKHWLASN